MDSAHITAGANFEVLLAAVPRAQIKPASPEENTCAYLLFYPLVSSCAYPLFKSRKLRPFSRKPQTTSACTAQGSPAWCDKAFTGLTDTQGSIETTVLDPPPAHVSNIPLSVLMYPGFNGKFLCEYQPWFDSKDNGNNGHKNVGYDEKLPPTAVGQDNYMVSVGCNINFVDFYGHTPGFNLDATNTVYSDIKLRSDLTFAILEDEGAFFNACNGTDEGATKSCIESNLEADMDYIHNNYTLPNPSRYWMDQGAFVVGYFGACGDFTALNCTNDPTDWQDIWGDVNTYVNTTHSYNFKFIFNFGKFNTPSESNFQTPSITAGEYGWPQPILHYNPANSSTQFCWGNNSESPNCTQYLDTLYCDTVHGSGCSGQWSSPGQITVGILYKGFDDTPASWGKDRIIAQQCGQVLIDTANEMAQYFQNNSQYTLPYVQVATWNDYEEGTEVETGINNCYTVQNVAIVGQNLQWNLMSSDSNANLDTVHHFTVWWSPYTDPNQTLHVGATNISANSTSMSIPISHLSLPDPSPDYKLNLYVEMIGMPLIMNQMSGAVACTVHGAECY